MNDITNVIHHFERDFTSYRVDICLYLKKTCNLSVYGVYIVIRVAQDSRCRTKGFRARGA
jgi:hypothetical protein